MTAAKQKNRAPNNEKFKELILYLADKSTGDNPFGATKLNKLLFYADFIAYLQLGTGITNQRYQKLENGPAPRALIPVTSKMEARGEIAYRTENYYGKPKKRLVPLRDPDLSAFSDEEVELVNRIIAEFWGKNAAAMSSFSHEFIGWQLAKIGEDIPYEVVFVRSRQANKKMEKYGASLESLAKQLLEEHEESPSAQDTKKRTVPKITS
jgi:hypothetical protein